MSLYNRHRPDTLDKVLGNEQLVEQLGTMLSRDDPPPPSALLFTGPHGCGKTTLGRIAASMLGASQEDFEEKDTADFRGIDTIREIRHNAMFRALRGKRRVWLLDECHKLTNDAQNALLKGLENPPSHAHFVLCTTEPDRLLPTIRSRCVSFQVKKLDERQMVRLLHRTAAAEGASLPRPLLAAIAERADGHCRDALQILEKVLSSPEDSHASVVADYEVSRATALRLAQALMGRPGWKAVASEIEKVTEDDVETVRRGVLAYCTKVLMSGENDRAGELLEEFREPFFSSGLAGLTLACYRVVKGGD